MGKISDKNTRIPITLPRDLKERIEQLAKKQNRSFSNLVVTLLVEYEKRTHEKDVPK